MKKVIYGVKTELQAIQMKCFECGSGKIANDPHGIKFCKNCGIVVEDWLNE